MTALRHPDVFYLNAAHGWLELGNASEALAELERLSPEAQKHLDVLQIRWQIAAKDQRWAEALELIELITSLAPENPFGWIHRSYCLHELKRTQEAWDSLLPLAEKYPHEWLIRYNLACYACQLGQHEEAKIWLARAAALGDPAEVEQLAAEDPDLKPLVPPGD
jgi:predicted Zn-dependent protease